jgi:hypothetical protein
MFGRKSQPVKYFDKTVETLFLSQTNVKLNPNIMLSIKSTKIVK